MGYLFTEPKHPDIPARSVSKQIKNKRFTVFVKITCGISAFRTVMEDLAPVYTTMSARAELIFLFSWMPLTSFDSQAREDEIKSGGKDQFLLKKPNNASLLITLYQSSCHIPTAMTCGRLSTAVLVGYHHE